MAPMPITCSVSGCSYNTPMGAEFKDMSEFMKLHIAGPPCHYPSEEGLGHTTTKSKVDKRPRPVSHEEMSGPDSRFFQSELQDYTRATGKHLLDELWRCMSADLRRLVCMLVC